MPAHRVLTAANTASSYHSYNTRRRQASAQPSAESYHDEVEDDPNQPCSSKSLLRPQPAPQSQGYTTPVRAGGPSSSTPKHLNIRVLRPMPAPSPSSGSIQTHLDSVTPPPAFATANAVASPQASESGTPVIAPYRVVYGPSTSNSEDITQVPLLAQDSSFHYSPAPAAMTYYRASPPAQSNNGGIAVVGAGLVGGGEADSTPSPQNDANDEDYEQDEEEEEEIDEGLTEEGSNGVESLRSTLSSSDNDSYQGSGKQRKPAVDSSSQRRNGAKATRAPTTGARGSTAVQRSAAGTKRKRAVEDEEDEEDFSSALEEGTTGSSGSMEEEYGGRRVGNGKGRASAGVRRSPRKKAPRYVCRVR